MHGLRTMSFKPTTLPLRKGKCLMEMDGEPKNVAKSLLYKMFMIELKQHPSKKKLKASHPSADLDQTEPSPETQSPCEVQPPETLEVEGVPFSKVSDDLFRCEKCKKDFLQTLLGPHARYHNANSCDMPQAITAVLEKFSAIYNPPATE